MAIEFIAVENSPSAGQLHFIAHHQTLIVIVVWLNDKSIKKCKCNNAAVLKQSICNKTEKQRIFPVTWKCCVKVKVSNITMVSYYNHPFAMYQKNHGGGSNLPYSASPSAAAWYSSNYHHQAQNAAAAQFLSGPGPDSEGHQPMYYPPPHVFHQSSPDWSSHDNYGVPPQTGSLLQTSTAGSLNNGLGGPGGFLSINQATQNHNLNVNNHGEHLNDGLQSLPSPPNTVSVGSDTSSPGVPHGPNSPGQMSSSRPTPVKSPYEWMKKPSYTSQPVPGNFNQTFLTCQNILFDDHRPPFAVESHWIYLNIIRWIIITKITKKSKHIKFQFVSCLGTIWNLVKDSKSSTKLKTKRRRSFSRSQYGWTHTKFVIFSFLHASFYELLWVDWFTAEKRRIWHFDGS